MTYDASVRAPFLFIAQVFFSVACDKPTPTTAPTVPAASSQTSAASTGAEAPVTSTASSALGENDNGKTVALRAGEPLTLTLSTNPTTGYDWAIRTAPTSLGDPKTEIAPPTESAEGSGTTRTWTWTPKGRLGAGEHALELGYRRHWEKNTAPLRTFKVMLKDAP